jgi:hypothetical protein
MTRPSKPPAAKVVGENWIWYTRVVRPCRSVRQALSNERCKRVLVGVRNGDGTDPVFGSQTRKCVSSPPDAIRMPSYDTQ